MSRTKDDGMDPMEGILADLESLRASREADDAQRDADPSTLSALDEIAEAAGRLREPQHADEDDGADDYGAADDAQEEAPARRPAAKRGGSAGRGPASHHGLFFTADDDHDDHDGEREDDEPEEVEDEDDDQDETDDDRSAPVLDVRNPFSHFSSGGREEFAPVAVPTGGGLLFQPPQAELAIEVEDEWDDSDDHDDRDSADADDHSADDRSADDRGSDDSDDDADSRGGDDQDDHDDRSRSRRRRGGRGRRARSRGGDASDSGDSDSRSSSADSRTDTDTDDSSHGDDGAGADSRADSESTPDSDDDSGQSSRRGGRRGRRRRSSSDSDDTQDDSAQSDRGDADAKAADQGTGTSADDDDDHDDSDDDSPGSRRRRRRRGRSSRSGGSDSGGTSDDQVTAIKGSTRLEAKRQRRREGREAGRRRPLLTEAEFLARRESVKRTMLVREQAGRTQLVVMEDGIAVEHYLSEHKAQASLIGNVYLGRVQNVLPSMEAAFIDIGKGRNAVLYAGEVNWDALGMNGKPHRIEQALSAGDPVLVQVTKDPVGHKGARLTSQISLPGRFLVYIPGNSMTGISRKLPDNERARLKKLLKEILPEKAGVIVRTASEGASDEELGRDVDRLSKRWESIEKKANAPKAQAPRLLYSEPDMIVRIIRDVFNEDFESLVIDGEDSWNTIHEYVEAVAPDLLERVSRYGAEETPTAEAGAAGTDIFDHFRVSEQIDKALHRKVHLPSGGSLVIDRTEAMTVVDVNTGKFTGSGGNLEETVTKNNLEAAEEVIRQLRLRDIGGIIVVDFIDMVLESNRDLVTRRLVECLARDRTRHQVAEVTSLGLVQMTRKRIGTGLAESLSAAGEDLSGRGLMLPGADEPDSGNHGRGSQRGGRKNRVGGGGGHDRGSAAAESPAPAADPETEKKQDQERSAVAAIAKATLRKSDDEDAATVEKAAEASADTATADQATKADQADASDRASGTDSADSTGEGESSSRGGRRSRSRGDRSRRRSRNGSADAQPAAETSAAVTEEAPATTGGTPAATEPTAPATEETAPAAASAEEPPAAKQVESWQAFVPATDSGPAPFMIGMDQQTSVQAKPATPAPAPEEAPVTEEPTEVASAEDSAPAAAAPAQPADPAPFLIIGADD